MPWLTWAGPPGTVSVERSRPQPTPWSLCRRRTASLSCPTHPGWAWPRFYSAERDPTLLVNPPVRWADTKGTTVKSTLWIFNHMQKNITHLMALSWLYTFIPVLLCNDILKYYSSLDTQSHSALGDFFRGEKLCYFIAHKYPGFIASHIKNPDMSSKQG